MSATTVLERPDGGTFQVTAGASDDGAGRHLIFSVPDTHDSLRLDWSGSADFSVGGAVPVSLRFGTLSAQQAVLTGHGITTNDPPDEPRFGPNVEAILRALAEAFLPLVLAHPEVADYIDGKVPKWYWEIHGKENSDDGKVGKSHPSVSDDGKVGKSHPSVSDDDATTAGYLPWMPAPDAAAGLASAAAQYTAAGSALGSRIAGSSQGAAIGAVIGAAVGVAAHLTESRHLSQAPR